MIRKKYSSKIGYQKKDKRPKIKIDFVNLIDDKNFRGKSATIGTIDFPKNQNLKKGWYVIDFNDYDKKIIRNSSNLLFIDKAPLKGLITYLSDWQFKGIGENTAQSIVDDIGPSVLSMIKGPQAYLKEKFKVKEETAKSLHEGWKKSKGEGFYEILLNDLNFTPSQKKYIKDELGISILVTLIKNPLSLLSVVPLMTFDDIEKICKKINFDISDEQKIIAITETELKKIENQRGHTCFVYEKLIPEIVNKTKFETSFIDETIRKSEKKFYFSERNKKEVIETERSYKRDQRIVKEINRITKGFQRGKSKKQFDKSELETQKGVELSDEQIEAINTAINHPVAIITGGPGAGKTTMVRALVSAIKSLKLKLKLTAPTGKAATRISNEGLKEYNPSTIHSYIGSITDKTEDQFDIMIVDEASMIDIDLMNELLISIPEKASIIFIGDADQLPPVGPGQMFKDLIESKYVPIVRLTGNYRQHLMSGIAKAAREIVKGRMPVLENDFNKEMIFDEVPLGRQADRVLEHYFDTLPQKLNIKPEDIQILSPQRTGEVGVYSLNQKIQQRLTRSSNPLFTKKASNDYEMEFFTGDKVIMRKNKVKEYGLVNGDIGRILRKSGSKIVTEFNENEIELSTKDAYDLELAYAITIHLSQGSDYSGVIIPCSSEHSFMLKRNLIYTGLTRAKDKAIFVGESSSLSEGIDKGWLDFRYTNIVNILK